MKDSHQHSYWSIGLGLFFVFAGAALLADNFGLTNFGSLWRFWPLVLIAMGIGHWIDAQTSEDRRKAFFWIFIGGWLLVSTVHIFGLHFHDSWPILLIGWGISAIWRSMPSGRSHHFVSEPDHVN